MILKKIVENVSTFLLAIFFLLVESSETYFDLIASKIGAPIFYLFFQYQKLKIKILLNEFFF